VLENKAAGEEIVAMEREKVFDAIRARLALSLSLEFGVFLTVLCSKLIQRKATNAFWLGAYCAYRASGNGSSWNIFWRKGEAIIMS
jgi:hypothetical protein